MKKIYIFIAAISLLANYGKAQDSTFAKQLIIANGGFYSDPDDNVTVGAYNFETQEYQVFDEIKTQSAQCVVVDSGYAYVAAQDSLVKYDLDNYSRVAAIELQSLKNIAVYKNILIVTRQYPATENCIYLLNKNDLSEIAKLNPSGETSGIGILNDTAYIAVPGAWGAEEGKLAIVDLMNHSIVNEMNFGSAAKGMKDVLVKNSTIYTVNTHFSDYTNNIYSISEFNLETRDTSTAIFSGDYYGFYGSSIIADNSILVPLSADIATLNINDYTAQTFTTMNPSAMVYDSISGNVFVTESDYMEWGKLYTYSLQGELVGDFVEIGVAPEGIAVDYRTVPLNIKEKKIANSNTLVVYPNPFINEIKIKLPENERIERVKVSNFEGKLVKSIKGNVNRVDLKNLPKGAYFVQVITDYQIVNGKIIKK